MMLEVKGIKLSLMSLSLLTAAICISGLKANAISMQTNPAISFMTHRKNFRSRDGILTLTRCSRGGAIDLDEESDVDEGYDVDEYDSEDDLEVDQDGTLVESAISAVNKAKKEKAEEAKRAMSKAILQSKVAMEAKKRKQRKNFSLVNKIPYILKALTNPFTVLAMTKGYFASLFKIDYMLEDESQNLRSALEEKAKKSGPSKGKRERKMRPGQAKTLSDLPQLSA